MRVAEILQGRLGRASQAAWHQADRGSCDRKRCNPPLGSRHEPGSGSCRRTDAPCCESRTTCIRDSAEVGGSLNVDHRASRAPRAQPFARRRAFVRHGARLRPPPWPRCPRTGRAAWRTTAGQLTGRRLRSCTRTSRGWMRSIRRAPDVQSRRRIQNLSRAERRRRSGWAATSTAGGVRCSCHKPRTQLGADRLASLDVAAASNRHEPQRWIWPVVWRARLRRRAYAAGQRER
jgi:hypothetical protein